MIAALAVEPHQRRGAMEDERPTSEFSPTPAAVETIDAEEAASADFNAGLVDAMAAAISHDSEITARPPGDEFRAFQIHDCYIVVAGDAGLEVIDQHALHERILYEHLRNRILSGGVERQRLLIPDTIECSATECAALLESLDLLKEIGFEVQEFGGTTILLMAHPTLIPRGNLTQIVKDFAEQLVQTDGKMTRRDLLDHMLHTMACRAAIKSGHRLTAEEMQELLRQRHLVDDSHH